MMESTALLVCGDPPLVETIQEVVRSLSKLRLRVVAEIEELLSSHPRITDAVILIHLARRSDDDQAARLLRMLKLTRQSVPVVVLSDEHRPKQILQLLRLGAADCLSRPLDLHRLAYLIDVLTVRATYTASLPVTQPVESLGKETLFFFVPKGAMEMLIEQVRRVAPQKTTVLLSGETGTGKTYLARVIHELSPRSSKPFLVVNCGMLSANLIESELFGHVKGAFTGADRDRTGKLAAVGGGTLLLDEIDALPLSLQPKLLRVLEERVFEPVGSNRTCAMEGRLIVASNRDLDREVAEGRFRSDLYYRLNVVGFALLPLRQRRALIAPLAEHFRADFAARDGRPVQRIAEEARAALQEYDWPGNIRELRNVVERAVALCAASLIEIADLPDAVQRSAAEAGVSAGAATLADLDLSAGAATLADTDFFAKGTLAQTKDEAEYQRIVTALRRHNNNRLRTAAELGISRMTLYKKLHYFGLIPAT